MQLLIEHVFKLSQVNADCPNPGKGKKKLTTAERWKKKKEAKTQETEEDQNSINITKLTELANELLTRTGNMDIYQESYEQIKKKVKTMTFIYISIHIIIFVVKIIFCRLDKQINMHTLRNKRQN